MRRIAAGVLTVLLTFIMGCSSDQAAEQQRENQQSDSGQNGAVVAQGCDAGASQTTIENTQVISESLGDLVFTTYSPLVSRFEDAFRIVVSVENKGSSAQEVELENLELDWVNPPADPNRRWYSQLFDLNPYLQTIAPGESKEFAWHLDADGDLEERGEVPIFRPTFSSNGQRVSFDIEIYTGEIYGDIKTLGLALDANVIGRVVDEEGNPIADAKIETKLFNFKERLTESRTNSDGQFALCVPSLDSYNQRIGNRPSGYQLSTFLIARTDDGGYGFASVSPKSGEEVSVEITLHKSDKKELSLAGESEFNTNHGFFWVYPLNDGFAATEGQHPPELRKTGSTVAVDSSAKEIWSVVNGDECWGFDVSNSGLVAAGCHDGTVTVWDSAGKQLWQRQTQKSQAMYARLVMFSNDGSKLIAGPLDKDVELLDALSGETIWNYFAEVADVKPRPEILRNARFSADDKTVIVGYSGGYLTSIDVPSGSVNWAGGFIGEFPLTLDIDDSGNVYAVGKGREAISIAPDGSIRWKKTVYEHVSTAAINSLVDGKFITHTVSGSVYALDAQNGEFLWWRKIGQGDMVDGYVETGGHNALDIDPVSGLIAHTETIDRRDGGGSVVTIMNSDGVVLDSKYFEDLRESRGQEVGHAQRGAMAVAFNKNGKLAAVFGDGMIRVFDIK